jgi:hypothetical protein
MVDAHGEHRAAAADHQGRQKAVHMIEARQVEKSGAAEHFQTAAAVRRVVLQQRSAHAIGDAR